MTITVRIFPMTDIEGFIECVGESIEQFEADNVTDIGPYLRMSYPNIHWREGSDGSDGVFTSQIIDDEVFYVTEVD